MPMQGKEQVPPVKKEKEVVTYARRDKEAGSLLARSQSAPHPAPAPSRQEVTRSDSQLVDKLLPKGNTEKEVTMEQEVQVTMEQEVQVTTVQEEQMKIEKEEPVKMEQEDLVKRIEEEIVESLVWSPSMVSNMSDCLDVARDSLDSTASAEVNPL